MPIQNRDRERLIVQKAREQGKSDDFIKQAILRDRQRNAVPAQTDMGETNLIKSAIELAPKAKEVPTKLITGAFKAVPKVMAAADWAIRKTGVPWLAGKAGEIAGKVVETGLEKTLGEPTRALISKYKETPFIKKAAETARVIQPNLPSTPEFFKQTLEEGTAVAPFAGLGKIPSAVMTAPMLAEGIKEKDISKLAIGAIGFLGAKGKGGFLAKEGRWVTPEIKQGIGIITKKTPFRPSNLTTGDLEKNVNTAIEKGIRPMVKKSSTEMNNYLKKANTAVHTIVENKPRLSFIDETGEKVNRLPQTLKEFSDSIMGTKNDIYKDYDALAKQATGKGAVVDLTSTASELEVVANNKVLQDIRPEVARYAQQQAERLKTRGIYDANETQDAIKTFNESLEAFYRNPTPEYASKAAIDAGIVNNLRKQLDEAVTGLTGKEYQQLKNKYGALKEIEKDVAKRAIVDARKNNKGLVDFADIFSGGDMVNGILTMNPAIFTKGIAQKGITEYFKFLNNPNRIIKKMFEDVDKFVSQKSAINLPPIVPSVKTKMSSTVKKMDEIKQKDYVNRAMPQEQAQVKKEILPAGFNDNRDAQYEDFVKILQSNKLKNPKAREAILDGDEKTFKREAVRLGLIKDATEADNLLYSQDFSGDEILDQFKAKVKKRNPELLAGAPTTKRLGMKSESRPYIPPDQIAF